MPAFVILWVTPGDTAEKWSWTITPDLTPIFLGAGYGAGAYFFGRTFLAKRWHPSRAGVFSASVFAALMLIATLIHWDKFNHGDAPWAAAAAFYGWTIVYILSPLVVMWVWWRNQKTDPGTPETNDPIVPEIVRRGAQLFAAGAILAASVFFIAPSVAMDIWPWELTPLTARVMASFMAQVGTGALLLSLEQRWSGWRLLVQTFFFATALLLLGALRASGDFDQDNPMTWLYLGGLITTDIALLVLYLKMHKQIGKAPRV